MPVLKGGIKGDALSDLPDPAKAAVDVVVNVVVAGLGGQGVLKSSDILADAAFRAGHDVKKSEVHGMSQRGGSVNSYVRFSPDDRIAAPLIPEGAADVMVAFEPLEGLRQIGEVAADGTVLVEERRIVPVTVNLPGFSYPDDVLDRLQASGREVRVVRASATAVELGEPRAANSVMLGALSMLLELPDDAWDEAMRLVLKPKAVDVNVQAFEAGRELVRA